MRRLLFAFLAVFAAVGVSYAQVLTPSGGVTGGGGGGSGTVTSVGTTGALTGGPITTSGTIKLATNTGTTSQWISSIDGSGNFLLSQPNFSDLNGSAACSQLPALTGDATTAAGSCATAVSKINGKTVTQSASSDFIFSGSTNSLTLPSGTTAQRPGTPVAGMERYNTTTVVREAYSAGSSTWRAYGGVFANGQSGAAVSSAAAGETNFAAVKIPGGILNANGMIRITALWKCTASATTKSIIYRWNTTSGATALNSMGQHNSASTTVSFYHQMVWWNANNTGAQVGNPPNMGFGATTIAVGTVAIDTTADTYININGTPNSEANLILEGYLVEVFPG